MPLSPRLPETTSAAKLSAPIDLAVVRRAFARPERMRDSDFLRREIARRMHERLALVRLDPTHVLDAGCGEGADLVPLQQRYPKAHIVGLDGAPAMLAQAAAFQQGARSSLDRMLGKWLPAAATKTRQDLLCGDFALLPFGTGTLDLVWSNLALHWHPQPDVLFAEWRRVLKVDGLLMFSCFGPDTFRELRAAFAAADPHPHALPFVDMHDFGDMLAEAGFSTPVMDMEMITVTYESLGKMLADMRAWGGNPLQTRRRGLMGRAAMARVTAALQNIQGGDGRMPLSFEVIYGHAFRPAPRTTSRGESIVRFDLPKK